MTSPQPHGEVPGRLPLGAQTGRPPAVRNTPPARATDGGGGKSFLSIGDVQALLRPDFPDVNISKIRFLGQAGLIEPERTSSGYRKFSRQDVARLRYVLAAQRDEYLPLRVIKERLDAIDRGLEPGESPSGRPRVPRSLVSVEEFPSSDSFAPELNEIRLSREELIHSAGITPEQLADLEQHQLIKARPGGTYFDGSALGVAKAACEMARFGIEPRHLRPFRNAADREIGLVEQVITPLVRQRSPEARARAEEVARELSALSIRLHAALVRDGLGPTLAR